MNPAFLTDPVPHSEAVDLIRSKPAVHRDVFDQLAPELRGRAFTITGIEAFDVMQAVQDKIATLPAGADWKKLRKEIAAEISPWLGEEEAKRRAKLLLNHHGRAAYAATHARVVHSQEDIFTHLQYRSSRTSKDPRESHQALDGLILPSNHPFWATHTPPWEFGCNCLDPIPLTQEDVDGIAREERESRVENRSVATPEQLAAIESGTLVRGPNAVFNIQTPREKSGTGYEWNWRDTTLPYEEIRKRWSEDVAQKFEAWADGIAMEGGTTLLAHLTGLAPGGGRMQTTIRAATFGDALSNLGLNEKETWTRQDIGNLRAAMRKPDARPAMAVIESIEGAKSAGALSTAEIRRGVQDVLDILPSEVAGTLPDLKIKVVHRLTKDGKPTNAAAIYQPGGTLKISEDALKGLKGEARRQEMRRILSHELMHWVHLDAQGPAAEAYRAAIKNHYAARTAGEALETAKEGYEFRQDGWWHTYAGREYEFEKGNAGGVELPSVYFELWEAPEELIFESDETTPTGSAFRETFSLVNSIFNSPPSP